MATKNPKRTIWAWLPALLVIAASVVTAAGVSLIPSATAASTSGNVTIQGTVDGDISFSSVCNDTSSPFSSTESTWSGALVPGGAARTLGAGSGAGNCQVVFSANDDAQLTVVDNTTGTPFFCLAEGTCAGTDAENFDNVAAGPVALPANDGFGMILESFSGAACAAACSTPGWTADEPVTEGEGGTAATADATDNEYYPITGTAQKVCGKDTTSTGTATCNIAFGAIPGLSGNQTAGTYSGQANFVASTL